MAYQYKIGVSGSAVNNCAPGAYAKSREIGRQIALAGAVCVTGDTVGIPHAAAHGAKAAGGITVGISPATSRTEHERKYRLPKDEMDIIMYTGFQYSGRNLLFIRSCDAIIFICGRIGTLNEFTIAFEDRKPIGILTGTGGVADELEHIMEVSQRGKSKVAIDDNPERLVRKVMELIEMDECMRELKQKKTCEIRLGKRQVHQAKALK
ncbi:MAG TPA: hypothetical protein VGE59_01500 [Patescibacteria group bacterium]